jgi:hypothetical protein
LPLHGLTERGENDAVNVEKGLFGKMLLTRLLLDRLEVERT